MGALASKMSSKSRSSYRVEYSDYWSKKPDEFHPFEHDEIDPILLEYENGTIDDRTVASKIFGVLFGKDFGGGGKHWSYDGQSIESINPPEGADCAFQCRESSTWDWKDIYSVAESNGTCIIYKGQKLIRFKNYKFYCSG